MSKDNPGIDYDEIDKRYDNETEPRPPGLDVPYKFNYIRYRAFIFLQVGPEAYRNGDLFSFPPEDWSETTLAAVTLGCEQIMKWRGVSPDYPLEGIEIIGFYALLRLFHFELVYQTIVGWDEHTFLDKMTMRHVVTNDEIILYNRVIKPESKKKPSGPPCPKCGVPLRTPRAKQCGACGADWHS